jgi:hypothetical protein
MPLNFTGSDLSPFGSSPQTAPPIPPSNQSTNLVTGLQSDIQGHRAAEGNIGALIVSTPLSGFRAGVFVNRQPVAVVNSASHTGARHELFGGQLFEKVIVNPRVKALKFVLSQTQFNIEVWNAFRELPQTLTAIVTWEQAESASRIRSRFRLCSALSTRAHTRRLCLSKARRRSTRTSSLHSRAGSAARIR